MPAQASGGDWVRKSGFCAGGGGEWDLKAKHDDGRLEIEFEVDTNRVGQVWQVRLTDNARVLVNRSFTTVAPSGSFEVNRLAANQAGVDVIHAVATRGSRTCSGTVRV